jgi:hypothetical protein
LAILFVEYQEEISDNKKKDELVAALNAKIASSTGTAAPGAATAPEEALEDDLSAAEGGIGHAEQIYGED